MKTLLRPGDISSSYCTSYFLYLCDYILHSRVNYCVFLALLSWKAPRYILNMPVVRHDRVRKRYHILVEGDGIPPPIKSFREMKFPQGKGKPDAKFLQYIHLPLCL